MPHSRLARLRPALFTLLAFLSIAFLTRLAIGLRPEVRAELDAATALRAFAMGTGFDLVEGFYLLAPFILWLALVPDRLARTAAHRVLVLAAFGAATFAWVVLAAAEWLFWEEFGGRFNFIAVDYLLYTHEVLGNIWQSYPVGKVLACLAMLSLGLVFALRRKLWRDAAAPLQGRYAIAAIAVLAIAIGATLRWVDTDSKNISPRDAANELAGNGAYEFFAANYRNELSYDRHYATVPLDEAMGVVRRDVQAEGDGVERRVRGEGHERRMNVVLVSVESLGAEFLGAYGNDKGLTPNLDRLARESLWFSNLYATGNRTVRGLEALTLALPPTPGQSIVRRPHNDMLFSLGSVFEDKGYDVLFAYGGYGYFDNMNQFFDANDYRSVDRRDIPSAKVEFANIWGVADEHLFDHVVAQIDRSHAQFPEKPFFAHVMTTSNHRPYTYPSNRIDIPSGTGREGAVKYTDYALGRLLAEARKRPWFEDTVFVITADHGANARGSNRIPVDKYRIPLFVYAPALVKPQRVDRLMSQIDIGPTVLGLLDFDYYSKFFGRDLLHSPESTDRAFVANYQTLGYVRDGRMALLQPRRKVEVFRVDPAMNLLEPLQDDAFAREAIAFYQSASHVFRNGLYLDEEQVPYERRAGFVRARHGGG
jgi:phosphoglycerol transferase MdoB-like AlkP superfamily enzyme